MPDNYWSNFFEDVENAPDPTMQGFLTTPSSAELYPVTDAPTDKDPKSLFFDPFNVINMMGYRQAMSNISYNTMKVIISRLPEVQAIINVRGKEVSQFAKPVVDRYNMGFRIRLRDRDAIPTAVDRKWMKDCENWLMTTGVSNQPYARDSFETFLKKLMYDSLSMDQAAFEVVPDRMGRPAEFYAVDGSSIRIADSSTTYMNEDLNQAIRYVQVYDGYIVAEYTQDELMFCVRNPRTDLRVFGYGYSEIEMLVTTITAMLNSFNYNQKQFSQGLSTKGLLNIRGNIPKTQLDSFRRKWFQLLSGIDNAHRVPVLNTGAEGEIQWVPLNASNRDMEFSAFYDFCLKVLTAVFMLDPSEINFVYGAIGVNSSLNQSSNEEKITNSRVRGLRPVLNSLSEWLNRGLIYKMNPDFELEFVGLDARTPEEIQEFNERAVRTTRTINELRAEDNLELLPPEIGDIILDSIFMQNKQAVEQKANMQQMAGQGFDGVLPGQNMSDTGSDGVGAGYADQVETNVDSSEPSIYIGPRGGKYRDPEHTEPYLERSLNILDITI